MDLLNIDLVGYLAGAFTTASFIPQILKSYRTKKVEDVSWGLVLAMLVGTLFWAAYGFLIQSAPIVIINCIFVVLVAAELYLKIRYEKRGEKSGRRK